MSDPNNLSSLSSNRLIVPNENFRSMQSVGTSALLNSSMLSQASSASSRIRKLGTHSYSLQLDQAPIPEVEFMPEPYQIFFRKLKTAAIFEVLDFWSASWTLLVFILVVYQVAYYYVMLRVLHCIYWLISGTLAIKGSRHPSFYLAKGMMIFFIIGGILMTILKGIHLVYICIFIHDGEDGQLFLAIELLVGLGCIALFLGLIKTYLKNYGIVFYEHTKNHWRKIDTQNQYQTDLQDLSIRN